MFSKADFHGAIKRREPKNKKVTNPVTSSTLFFNRTMLRYSDIPSRATSNNSLTRSPLKPLSRYLAASTSSVHRGAINDVQFPVRANIF